MKIILNKIWSYYKNKSIAYFRINELNALFENVDQNRYKKIIDIGSGDGFLTRLIFKKAFILGIDNNEAGDAKIARKFRRINEFKFQDAKKKWDIKSGIKYDLVFSNSVLEHIPNVYKVIKNASSLNYKHDFIFTVPNNYFEKSLFPQIFYQIPIFSLLINKISSLRNRQLNHYNTNKKIFWIRLFKKNGYKLIKIHGYLTSDQIVLWNINAVLYKFFKINIIKKRHIFKKKSSNYNCCYLFVFRKK